MDEQTKYMSLIQLWKTTRTMKPDYIWRRLEDEDYGRLSTDILRLNLTAISFRCKSVLLWNRMSESLRSETSLRRFKTGLKREMIDGRRRTVTTDPDDDDADLMTDLD